MGRPRTGGVFSTLPQYAMYAKENLGKHRAPTLRNVDLRPTPGFVKAYGHNGYFKSLEAVVHFYNTRDVLPEAGKVTDPKPGINCWPAPEVSANLNKEELGDLKLTPAKRRRRGIHENPFGWLQAPGVAVNLHRLAAQLPAKPVGWSGVSTGANRSDLLNCPFKTHLWPSLTAEIARATQAKPITCRTLYHPSHLEPYQTGQHPSCHAEEDPKACPFQVPTDIQHRGTPNTTHVSALPTNIRSLCLRPHSCTKMAWMVCPSTAA